MMICLKHFCILNSNHIIWTSEVHIEQTKMPSEKFYIFFLFEVQTKYKYFFWLSFDILCHYNNSKKLLTLILLCFNFTLFLKRLPTPLALCRWGFHKHPPVSGQVFMDHTNTSPTRESDLQHISLRVLTWWPRQLGYISS